MASVAQLGAIVVIFVLGTTLPGTLWLVALMPRTALPWPERLLIGTGLGLVGLALVLLAARFLFGAAGQPALMLAIGTHVLVASISVAIARWRKSRP